MYSRTLFAILVLAVELLKDVSPAPINQNVVCHQVERPWIQTECRQETIGICFWDGGTDTCMSCDACDYSACAQECKGYKIETFTSTQRTVGWWQDNLAMVLSSLGLIAIICCGVGLLFRYRKRIQNHHSLDQLKFWIHHPVVLQESDEQRNVTDTDVNTMDSHTEISEIRDTVPIETDNLLRALPYEGLIDARDSTSSSSQSIVTGASSFEVQEPGSIGETVGHMARPLAGVHTFCSRTDPERVVSELEEHRRRTPRVEATTIEFKSADGLEETQVKNSANGSGSDVTTTTHQSSRLTL